MKKIIPFKKDIIFKTNLSEITSIALEHTLHTEGDDLITGEFVISGEYKMADDSVNTEPFSFNLPFDITLDSSRYILDNVAVDIDDFYYEIINDNVLSVNIEVSIDKLEEKPLIEDSPVIINNMLIDEESELENSIGRKEEFMDKEELKDNDLVSVRTESSDEESRTWFDSFDNSKETYTTYKIYIVKEGDSIELILQKYGIVKEDLEKYNDLNEIKIGAKLIIPATSNAQN